jgi:hypothetical protein
MPPIRLNGECVVSEGSRWKRLEDLRELIDQFGI